MAKLVQSPAPKLRDDDAARKWAQHSIAGKENKALDDSVMTTPSNATSSSALVLTTTATPVVHSGGEPLEELHAAAVSQKNGKVRE